MRHCRIEDSVWHGLITLLQVGPVSNCLARVAAGGACVKHAEDAAHIQFFPHCITLPRIKPEPPCPISVLLPPSTLISGAGHCTCQHTDQRGEGLFREAMHGGDTDSAFNKFSFHRGSWDAKKFKSLIIFQIRQQRWIYPCASLKFSWVDESKGTQHDTYWTIWNALKVLFSCLYQNCLKYGVWSQ
jgi:hypothetical protein